MCVCVCVFGCVSVLAFPVHDVEVSFDGIDPRDPRHERIEESDSSERYVGDKHSCGREGEESQRRRDSKRS